MDLNYVDLIGLAAATLTTGSFLPQVIRLWRTQNADGVSLLTFSIFSIGVLLWLTYGILLRSTPIIAANGVMIVFSVAVVVQVVRIRTRAREAPRRDG
jgi:MtN3 and saliva related transmembrane protein